MRARKGDEMRYEPVDPKVRFPELEERILAWWREADVFARTLELRADAPVWRFYEGPPTANGKPGIHHVEPRTFKDVYPRYQTMTGHLVPRKGGWDCHGLPVEIEVEKEIGTTGKRDIETYGVAAFNERCRASVQRYVGEFERLTERIGFWIDMSDAYWTMSTPYIESVWWSLQRLHQRGLLEQDHKVTAYCPRCGTALSDAEVAQGYEQVADPSLFVRFPIVASSHPELVGASLLVWTTTPWTLPSNEGVAALPDGTYAVYARDGERMIVATSLADRVLDEGWSAGEPFEGTTLVGSRYEPPYPNVEGAHTIVAADFVSMTDGTGLVHMAPAFGPDDLAVGRAQGWPVWRPVADDGTFTDDAPAFVRGLFVKDADPVIIDELRSRGIVFRAERYEHAYPFCWRCKTPLLYLARTSWYVRTTAVRDRMLAVNDTVHWYPEHIRHGRFGNWLENNVDWALSRERYWGTPLPIWRCTEGHDTAIGSLAELSDRVGRDVTGVDPHRPFIDEITFACPTCGATATRVPEVIDTWYDSGAMPFAQWGYHPDLGRGVAEFEAAFPADFISEAIDQTRGWFYTLMAEGVLHFDQSTYRNVVCLGHLIAEDGRKMSKSLGNQFDPWEALDRQGADALRWWMLTNGSPWESRRIGHDILDENVRRFLLPLWNVFSFFVTYANASGIDADEVDPAAIADAPVLDRWIASQLAGTVREVRDRMDAYDATGAGRRIQTFVDDLSTWYVRRSRRRFWNPAGTPDDDTAGAFATLHTCLVTLAQLLAPFTPFVAEAIWRTLAAGRAGRPDSVHLSDFPVVAEHLLDPGLDDAMATARQVVELGRRVRVETKVRIRQPLAEAIAHVPEPTRDLEALLPIVAEELNVHRVRFATSEDPFGTWRAKPDFKVLGPRLGSRVKSLAATLAADADGTIAGRLATGSSVSLEIDDGPAIEVGPGDVELIRETLAGWGVASDGGVTVALELALTPALEREGLARELVRVVQDARKAGGLAVSDRIALGLDGDAEIAAVREEWAPFIAGETLATELAATIPDASYEADAEIDDRLVRVQLRAVG
jgi:isoleucyl-tRNA synthetase